MVIPVHHSHGESVSRSRRKDTPPVQQQYFITDTFPSHCTGTRSSPLRENELFCEKKLPADVWRTKVFVIFASSKPKTHEI